MEKAARDAAKAIERVEKDVVGEMEQKVDPAKLTYWLPRRVRDPHSF